MQCNDLFGPHPHDDRDAARDVVWIQRLAQRHELGWVALVGDLDPDRIAQTAAELDVRAVQLSRALTNPDHVGGAIVPRVRFVDRVGVRIELGLGV